MLNVRSRRLHSGAEQSIIRFPKSAAYFAAHVHLDQRELLEILRVDLVVEVLANPTNGVLISSAPSH
jgi:hypothetical protein